MIMAEYKLSYTASDIDAKLGKIDGTKTYYNSTEIDEKLDNKQDSLTFDSAPTENSENMVTSGGVYAAIQNIDIGESYTAGDYIEIENGVIKSTLGKAETAISKEDLLVLDSIPAGESHPTLILYMYGISEVSSTLTIGDIVNIDFTEAGLTEPTTFNNVEVIEYDGMTAIYINSSSNDLDTILESGFDKIDENSIGLVIVCSGSNCSILSTEDLTGSSIRIHKQIETTTYITLPNEALTFDNEPIENSTNLVNSGDLYNVIGDINTVITQINTLIGGAS